MDELNGFCKQHSGFESRIKHLEDNVLGLWDKWDNMQKTILGIFVALSLNLIGVVALLMRALL